MACTIPFSLASFVQREVARLAVTEGLFFLAFPQVQSLSRKATAPFTQGSLYGGENRAKLKLFRTNSRDGGFLVIHYKGMDGYYNKNNKSELHSYTYYSLL